MTAIAVRDRVKQLEDALVYLVGNDRRPFTRPVMLVTNKTIADDSVTFDPKMLGGFFGRTMSAISETYDASSTVKPDSSKYRVDSFHEKLRGDIGGWHTTVREYKPSSWNRMNGYPENWNICTLAHFSILSTGEARELSTGAFRRFSDGRFQWLTGDATSACDRAIGETPATVTRGFGSFVTMCDIAECVNHEHWTVHAKLAGVTATGHTIYPTSTDGVQALRDIATSGTSSKRSHLIKWIDGYSQVRKGKSVHVSGHLRGNHRVVVDNIELCVVPPTAVLQEEMERKGTRAELVRQWLDS